MPNWKKVIVSGSNADLNQITGSALQLKNLGDENEIVIVGANTNVTSSNLLSIDTSNNRVGIGTSSPDTKLHIAGNGNNEGQIRLQQANNGGDGPDFAFYSSRGTIDSPSAVQNNDTHGRINAYPYNGTSFTQAGSFGWSATDGTGNNRFDISTRVSDTLAKRVEITSTGDVDITGDLDVAGSITGSSFLSEGNILPDNDNVHSLGTSNKRFLLNGGTPVTVTGSGTANTITRFQGDTTVEDSKITSTDTQTIIEHDNNGNNILIISGSNGQMLTVSDEVGDNLFTVNNSSGLERFSVSSSGQISMPALSFVDNDFVLSYNSSSGIVSFSSASDAVSSSYADTASIALSGDGIFSGSFSGSINASSFSGNGLGIVSGSGQIPALLPSGTVSGSAQTVANLSNQDVDLGTGDLTATDITSTNFTINDTLTAPTITGSLLRLSENGSGLRLTNVGGFEPQSGVFNIFGNNNVTFGAGGSGASERVLTLVESNRHAQFEAAVSASVFSGSFVGDGSGLTGVVSSSFAVTASYAVSSSQAIHAIQSDRVSEVVKNNTGVTMGIGTPVHFSGQDGGATEVIVADASDPTRMPCHGILEQALNNGETGNAVVVGEIEGNTSAFSIGDTLFVAVGGGLTTTKPTGEGNLIQNIGVVKLIGNPGKAEIFGAGRANDVPNILSGSAWVGNSDGVAVAVPTASFLVDTASYADTASIALSGDGIFSGSFSGSFQGDGSNLSGITVTQIATAEDTFTSVTSYTASHGFNTKNVFVNIYDNNDELLLPATLKTLDSSSVAFTFDTSTSGRVVIGKAGHIVQAEDLNSYRTGLSGSTTYDVTHSLDVEFPLVQTYLASTKEQIIPSKIKSLSTDAIQVEFDTSFSGSIVVKK